MALTIKNQTPGHVTPGYKASPKGDFDVTTLLTDNLVKDLLTPLNPNQPVTVKEDGQTIDEATIATAIQATFGDVISGNAEASVKTLLDATMLHYNKQFPTKWLFPIQGGTRHKLLLPTDQIIYTAQTDIIPTCRQFLAGGCDEEYLLANFAFYAKSQTFGVWCLTGSSFDDFKAYLKQQAIQLQASLPGDTFALLQDVQKLKLNDLTTSLILRKDTDDGNEEYSFPRVFIWLLQKYIKQHQSTAQQTGINKQIGYLPFDLQELYAPRTVTFVNIETHARANVKKIQDEWELINNALKEPIQILSKRQITKLGSTQRAVAAAQQKIQAMKIGQNKAYMALNRKFSSTRPPVTSFIKKVKKCIAKMESVANSRNTYSIQGRTYMRANRRDPTNINLMGRTTKTHYRPDIHLYIDTSGSISEDQYQDAVKSCIVLAKKLDVDLYFNSFSHVLSETTLLKVKSKSVKQIYAQFQKTPKVTGGTIFAQVWDYITSDQKRKKEFSLMITDFGDTAPSRYMEHPSNLYYTACSQVAWDNILRYVKNFCDSATHLDPAIRTKLLF